MEGFAGDLPFLHVASVNYSEKIDKHGFPQKPTPTKFEADGDGDLEYNRKSLHDQVKSTSSSMETRTIRYEDEIFYQIYPTAHLSNAKINDVLARLGAEIVDIDVKTQEFVARGSSTQLAKYADKKKLPQLFLENIRRIRPIPIKQQIPEHARRIIAKDQAAIFGIMPNNTPEMQKKYRELLMAYLRDIRTSQFVSLDEAGLVFAKIDLPQILRFLQQSTFVHFVAPVPQGITGEIKPKISKTRSTISTMPSTIKSDTMPVVAVLDSGVNRIRQLNDVIVDTDSHGGYNPRDITGTCGHGTSVASLLCLGENLDDPKARIISYKIFENPEGGNSWLGMMEGIGKYHKTTRIFHSSVNFPTPSPKLEARLERLIQNTNIVFVNSAGNIAPEEIESGWAVRGYPDYLCEHGVYSPSCVPAVVAVGSIASVVYSGQDGAIRSIAGLHQVAPYSRCAPNNPDLYECTKPDLVENGANLNMRNGRIDQDGVGQESFDNAGNIVQCFGTSMSAPPFARKVAQLESRYGGNIRNSETLRALSYVSCTPTDSPCTGLGRATLALGCDRDHSVCHSEGTVDLVGESTGKYYEKTGSEFTIKVPFSTKQIDLCLVHGDNFSLAGSVRLNTYLSVDAYKTASASKVTADDDNNRKKTNIKMLQYRFRRRNMGGMWTFKIRPHALLKTPRKYKEKVQTGYGAAVVLSREQPSKHERSMYHEIQGM